MSKRLRLPTWSFHAATRELRDDVSFCRRETSTVNADKVSLSPLACAIARFAGDLLAPGRSRGRLAILIYHRVLAQPDPLYGDEVDRASFDWQMGLLARCFSVLPFNEAVARLQANTLPPRAACVTFDDGYRDNHDIALSVLRKWKIPAAFFIATSYLEGGCMWNDAIRESIRVAPGTELDLTDCGHGRRDLSTAGARRDLARYLIGQFKYLESSRRAEMVARVVDASGARMPTDLMMHPAQVRALHDAGMTIGAHTATHPILARVSVATARQEIAGGREALAQIVGRPIEFFAYPNGMPGADYTAEHVDLVRALGFSAAVSTVWGTASRASSMFELPRFTPWDNTPVRFTARLLHNYLRVAPILAQPASA